MAALGKQCSCPSHLGKVIFDDCWVLWDPSVALRTVRLHNVVLRNPLFIVSELYFFTGQACSSEIYGGRKCGNY